MSLFLSQAERDFIKDEYTDGIAARQYWTTLNRVMRRAESPGLIARTDTTEWWYGVEEIVSEAAMMQALQPSPQLATWLRDVTLSLIRRSVDDWIGPWFRNHSIQPPHAELETGHVTRAVAIVLDLAPDVLSDAEREETKTVLRERAIPMAARHIEHDRSGVHNHRCVINAGLAVAAAVLDDRAAMQMAAREYRLYCQAYQPDGTYAETLQYANYATWSMMLVYESLVRRDPAYAESLPMRSYAGYARWAAYSFLYMKPLDRWGQQPRPCSVNFGDSAALFSPSAEVLLHIASRAKATDPADAAVARWLYETADDAGPALPPHDQATFGFQPRPGFLTMPLLANATAAQSPQQLNLPTLNAFSCGDAIARDRWIGRTVVAMRCEGEPKHVVSHLHGDLNHFVLTHNRERLLVDSGHSCYRNVVHEYEVRTPTHNTVVFHDSASGQLIEQVRPKNRTILDLDTAGPLIDRGTKRLLARQDGALSVMASDAAAVYASGVEQFVRVLLLCGPHVVFVVDHIVTSRPLIAQWNWLLNNRDDGLDWKAVGEDRIIARRGDAGMKLIHLGRAHRGGPSFAYVHDCYHPLPGQPGEGKSGSGVLLNWRERQPATKRTVVHAIALDDTGRIAGWHLKSDEHGAALWGGNGRIGWTLGTPAADGAFIITESATKQTWSIGPAGDGTWSMSK